MARFNLPDLTVDQLSQTILSYKVYLKCIISLENTINENIHFHVFIQTPESVAKNARQNFVNKMKASYPALVGNGKFSCKFISETPEKAGAYTLKDGQYSSYGFTDEELKYLEKLSYKKFKKEDFKSKLELLEMAYTLRPFNNKSLSKFVDDYMDLRDSYKHNVNFHQVTNYISNVTRRVDKQSNIRFRQQVFEFVSETSTVRQF